MSAPATMTIPAMENKTLNQKTLTVLAPLLVHVLLGFAPRMTRKEIRILFRVIRG